MLPVCGRRLMGDSRCLNQDSQVFWGDLQDGRRRVDFSAVGSFSSGEWADYRGRTALNAFMPVCLHLDTDGNLT